MEALSITIKAGGAREMWRCAGAPTRSGVRWSTHSRNIMEGGAIILISLITSYKEVPTPI